MSSEETRSQCKAMTKQGERCKNEAAVDSEYCHIHDQTAAQQGDEPEHADRFEEMSQEEQRQLLAAEMDDLVDRVKAVTPDYEPPPFSPRRLMALIEESLSHLPPALQLEALGHMQTFLRENLFDLNFWKGLWFMLNYTIKHYADMVKRRYTGEYDTDEWGLDWEFLDAVRPFFLFMYKVYWRVETTGIDQIPIDGRTLLVANHSGQLPWDGSMVGTAVLNDHPAGRLVRTLYADWFPTLPVFSHMFVKLGQTLATVENGTRLLEQDELVAVYPEGYKGVGKLYKDRYRLARFGRGGFVKMALNTGAPIVPVSVVGAEETYISLTKSSFMAKVTGFPYFPISPTFPWLGLLGFVPLPTKWYIDFGEPIPTAGYGPDAADNLVLVSQLADQVRNIVQEMIEARLAQRRSVFFG